MVELEDEAELRVAQPAARRAVHLGDVLAAIFDGAVVGGVEGAEDVQERALARAAAPLDGDELAGLQRQVHVLEHLHGAVAHAERLLHALRAQDRPAGGRRDGGRGWKDLRHFLKTLFGMAARHPEVLRGISRRSRHGREILRCAQNDKGPATSFFS